MNTSNLLVVDRIVSVLTSPPLLEVQLIILPSVNDPRAVPPATNEFAVTIPVTFTPDEVTVSIPTLSILVSTLEATV